MKFNKKLWTKFIKNRVYGFDLIKINEDGTEDKIIRFVAGTFVTEYRGEDGKQVNILSNVTNKNLQIYSKMSGLNAKTAFLLCRKICQQNKSYKLRLMFVIKELR